MKRFLSLLLLCTLLFSSCKDNSGFDVFCNRIFVSEVSSDALTLNYSLCQPENYQITSPPTTMGTISYDAMKASLVTSENLLDALQHYSYSSLSDSEQMLYDILTYTWKKNLQESDFLYYREFLSPTIGTQAQLPVLLSEFHFYETKDYDTYLSLISSVPAYLDSLMTFEQEKAQKGLFMSKGTAQRIIKQCQALIATPAENMLITSFNHTTQNDKRLTNIEITSLQSKNRSIVLNEIIPAYERIISGLTGLSSYSNKSGGLCSLPRGRDYYQLLVSDYTGSDRSLSSIESLLTSYLNDAIKKLRDNPSEVSLNETNPEQILASLKTSCQKDFPTLPDEQCTIKYVDSSQSDFLSPAFYLTPPLDSTQNNVIYINPKSDYTTNSLYTTLAHEGYPGHLFQNVYYASTHPYELRTLLDFPGYAEGWATYAETYVCQYSGLTPYRTIISLCLYGLIDLGVNDKGWSLSDIKQFLSPFGIHDAQTLLSIYQSVIDEPANYLKYTLGYLEFCELKNEAKQNLGSSYSDLKFHTFVLSAGPAPFSIIKKSLKEKISCAIISLYDKR